MHPPFTSLFLVKVGSWPTELKVEKKLFFAALKEKKKKETSMLGKNVAQKDLICDSRNVYFEFTLNSHTLKVLLRKPRPPFPDTKFLELKAFYVASFTRTETYALPSAGNYMARRSNMVIGV